MLGRHPLIGYFVLAICISWLIELPLLLDAQRLVALSVPYSLHYLAAFGPLLAAVLVTGLRGGRSELRVLLSSAFHWRIGTGWLLVAVASPLALFATSTVVARVVEGAWPDLSRLGEVNFLGDIGAPWALVLWIASFGFGEETGWRGFALPRLQRRHSALAATLVLTALWGLWHVPTFFYLPTYVELGLAGVPGFAVGLLLGSIMLTWLYNSTGGSLFAVSMWHALYDFFSAAHATDILMNGVMAAVVMVWAVALILMTGTTTLSRSGKVVWRPAATTMPGGTSTSGR